MSSEAVFGGILDFLRFNGYVVDGKGGIPKLRLLESRVDGVVFQFLVRLYGTHATGTRWVDICRVDDPGFFERLGGRLNEVRVRRGLRRIDHRMPGVLD